MGKYLIINADDFGASTGVNRGILECYTRGVVTSTSLMVTGRAVAEAVAMSYDYPGLAVGLHWDVWGEAEECGFDINDISAVRDEFYRQVDEFYRLLGRMPTHVDSHRHTHLRGDQHFKVDAVLGAEEGLNDIAADDEVPRAVGTPLVIHSIGHAELDLP